MWHCLSCQSAQFYVLRLDDFVENIERLSRECRITSNARKNSTSNTWKNSKCRHGVERQTSDFFLMAKDAHAQTVTNARTIPITDPIQALCVQTRTYTRGHNMLCSILRECYVSQSQCVTTFSMCMSAYSWAHLHALLHINMPIENIVTHRECYTHSEISVSRNHPSVGLHVYVRTAVYLRVCIL